MGTRWTLEEGLRLVRALQPSTRQYGYHLALGGGVLNNGESEKDLDLYFLPLNNPKVAKDNPEGLVKWLTGLWGDPEPIGASYDEEPENPIPLGPQGIYKRPIPRNIEPKPYMLGDFNLNKPLVFKHEWVIYDGKTQATRDKPKSSYKFKLKFQRAGGDRIDIFIL